MRRLTLVLLALAACEPVDTDDRSTQAGIECPEPEPILECPPVPEPVVCPEPVEPVVCPEPEACPEPTEPAQPITPECIENTDCTDVEARTYCFGGECVPWPAECDHECWMGNTCGSQDPANPYVCDPGYGCCLPA